MKKLNIFSLFGMAVLSFGLFISCEIGLGSSVDVEAPKIEFSKDTVTAGAVVRDAFSVHGSCEDDGTIGSISATLTNLSTRSSIKKSGSHTSSKWHVSFDPKTENIPDGSYELTIVIKDSAGHSSKVSRALIIDNTPPLVVLSRPSTKNGASSFDSYGQKFTLEGKAADDNDVSLIEVKVYADATCSGTPLKTIPLPNVPLTIESDVAEYSNTEANDYSVIYGQVDASGIAKRDGGTVSRYCKLVVYDGAQRYPADGSAQSEADKKGNSIDYYYLNTDLAQLFTDGYKITELYHILNGTYTSSGARATSEAGVVKMLKDDTNRVKIGQFKLNPENSPHFVVSARNTLKDAQGVIHTTDEYPITNGNTRLEVELTPGLDGHLIKKETVGVYLVRCNVNGEPLAAGAAESASPVAEKDAKKVWLIKPGANNYDTYQSGLPITSQAEIQESGSTYKFKTIQEIGNGTYTTDLHPDVEASLEVGENYYVAVVGKDMQGNSILCEGIYGFQLITSGNNIEVGYTSSPAWLSTEAEADALNKSVTIKLTYAVDNKPFEIYRGLDSSSMTKIADNIQNSPYVDTSLDISSEPTSVVYKVYGNNSAESNFKTIELKYDDTKPTVSITEKPDSNATEQSTITFRGKASDENAAGEEESGVKAVYVQIIDGTNTANATPAYGEADAIKASYSGGEWLCQITPGKYAAAGGAFNKEGSKTIKVTAVDGVGLTKEASTTFVYDKAKPAVAITGSELNGEAATNIVPVIVGKKLKLKGTASDGYGIKKIEIQQTKGNVTVTRTITKAASWTTPYLPLKSNTEDYDDDDFTAHLADGDYTYKIIVTDNENKTNDASAAITLNTQAPTLNVTSPDFSKWQTTNSITVRGNASCTATITGVYYKLMTTNDATPPAPENPKEADSWLNAGWTEASGTNSWSITLENVPNRSNNKLCIASADESNNATAVQTNTLKVDASKPTLDALFYNLDGLTPEEVTGQIYVDGTKAIDIYGKCNDGQSGISELKFKLKDTNLTLTPQYCLTEPASGSDATSLTYDKALSGNQTKVKYWKVTIPTTAINAKDKCGDLIVTSKNAAGLTEELKIFKISFDNVNPGLSNITLDSSTKKHSKESESLYWINNGTTSSPNKVTISGVASDNCGIKSVVLTVDGTSKDMDTNSTLSEWVFKNIDLSSYAENAEATVKITVTDVAGRSFSKQFKIKFDKTNPLAMHWADAKHKDIYFRIGKADNDKTNSTTWETGDASPAKDSDNTDVGKKYSFGSWGNDSTIEIRGYFKENGSGLKTIHYAIFDAVPTSTQISNLVAGTLVPTETNHVKVVSSFAPLETTVTKKIPYNKTAAGAKAAKEDVPTNFRQEIPGFNAQNNYLVLVAEDKVGNKAADTLAVTEGTASDGTNNGTAITNGDSKWNSANHSVVTAYYNINKDVQSPNIAGPAVTSFYTNGDGDDITISGTASDVLAGLDNVTVTIEEISFERKIETFTGTDSDTWTATVPVSNFADDSITTGAYTVYAKATDRAGVGNTKQISAGTIYVDKTAPTVAIKSPVANAKVGKTFTISGTASDGNGAGLSDDTNKHMTLYYSTKEPAKTADGKAYKVIESLTPVTNPANGWVKLDDTIDIETEWSKAIDVSSITTDGQNKVLYFTISSIDASGTGNIGYAAPFKYTVDRKKPVYDNTETSIGGRTHTQMVATPTPWINSDGTVVVKGKFTDDGTTGSGVSSIIYTVDSNPEVTLPTTDGSFNTNISGFTANSTLVLKAVDAVGNESAPVSYTVKVDGSLPEISEVTTNDFKKIILTNGTAAQVLQFHVTDTGSGIATDSSALKSVKVGSKTISHGTATNSSKFTVTAVNGQTNKWLVKITLGTTDLSSLTGNNTVLVSVQDQAGNESVSQIIGTVNVDKDKPVPSYTSPASGATVNGKIALAGRVTDESNSEISKIVLTATSGSTSKIYEFPAPASSTGKGTITYSNGLWSIAELDTTAFYNDVSSQALSLSMTATDAAGNTSAAKTLSLTINQNTDRPVVKFTNLQEEPEGSKNYILKYGNNARLEGTISDDDGTDSGSPVVQEFKASSTAFTYSTNASTGVTTFTGVTGITTFTPSSGDFKFTPAETEDGTKTVYFYIKDNAGKEFYSMATGQLDRPYQQYKDVAQADDAPAAALTYKSDSKSPVINYARLQAYTAATGNTQNGSQINLGDSCSVGGKTKNYIDIVVSARDDNGIDRIEIKANGTTYKSTVTADGTKKENDGNGNFVFTTKRINLTNVAEGSKDVSVVVYDKSGLYSNQETSFFVDRTAPGIDITTPASNGVTYYGTIKQNIAAGLIGGGDVSKVYFKVSEDDSLENFTDGVDITSVSAISASIVFDGDLTSQQNGYHTWNLHDWIAKLRADPNEPGYDASYNIEENDTNVPLYIYYKAEDSCGNFTVDKRLINVIPNGDKPTVTISYPENKNGATPALAGTIRLYGTTDIQSWSVDSVYIQIAPNYPESGTGYDWANWESALTSVTTAYSSDIVEIPFSGTKQDDGTYINNIRGIKAKGTADNWNLPINGSKEFDVQTGQRHMAIRVFAVSDTGTDEQGRKKGKVSDAVVQPFNVDITAPHIGGDDSDANNRISLQLVQFESGKEGQLNKITSRAAYKSDMWVTGNWYLLASVWDDNGIKTITLDEHKNAGVKNLVDAAAAQSVTTVDSKTCYVASTDTPANASATNFNICIPLPTGAANTSGSVTYTIEATENTNANLSSVETVKINYDNTPPKIGGSNYVLEAENMFANPKVYDEDGFYKLKGYVSDSGTNASGLLGVAFYFVRRGSKNSVYDPMYYQKNEVSIASAKAITDTLANNDIVYANGLYWKHKTLEARTDSLTEIKLAAADVNIHKGGLVMLGGQIYKIRNLSADGKTITLNDSAPKTITTADFALAMLVDNRNTESQGGRTQDFTDNTAYGYGYYPFNANEDDGDLMVERLGGDLEGRWEASIYSHNIKDGPIEIHYVAFDKAQNYTIGIIGNVAKATYEGYQTKDALEAAKLTTDGKPSTESTASGNLISYYDYYYDSSRPASVSNNAPRVASVTVGVDYDNSGTITDSERETEYAGRTVEVRGKTKSREIKDKFDVPAIFTIKAKTDVGFEIIGGNGNLYYRYKMGNSAWQKNLDASNNPIPMTVTPYSEVVNGETQTEGKYLDDDTGASYYNASKVSPIQIPLSTINTLVTANTSAASPSLWTIELWDSTEDTVVFTNSQFAQVNLKCNVQTRDTEVPNTVISPLYWKSSTDNSVYINPATDKLEGHIELKDYLTAALRTEYDDGATTGDDKVSGKVVFRGYAWDNKLLKKLEWAIVNKDGTKSLLPYDANTIKYSYGAEYSNGTWDNLDVLSTSGYSFTVKTDKTATFNTDGTEAYIDKKGHKVAWELVVDTSKVFGVSVQDVKLYVRATDAAGKETVMTAEASPAANVTDQEAIDRGTKKPTYKVDIVPYITGIKSRLDDNRSSNGVYQLADNEADLELIGYNLSAGNENLAIDVPTASTNNYSVTVNTHPSINNLNDNEAVGGITDPVEAAKVRNKYNYQPNAYNNTLTDDVKIQLWEFNNRAAQTNTGFGFVQEPVMKFNPSNGNLGFSFSNGANKFSMAQGTTNSYILWEYNYASYVRNALAFDERGRSHGVSVGIDTEPSSGKSGRMNYFYSGWGRSDYNNRTGNFSDNTNSNHIDCIGIPNGNNLNSNTPPDNAWANCIIMEQRFKSVSIAATSKGDGNYTANPRVYIAYYDDIREQITFKYGTITGNARSTYNQIQSEGNPNGGDGRAFSVSGTYWSVIADGGTATPYKPGEYLDIAVIPGTSVATDVVCAVWFDATNNKLMYSYKVNPGTDNDASTRTGDYASGYWSNAVTLKKNCGEYCKVAIDANGGVHITAYDRGSKGVGYVYLPSYNSAYTEANNYYIIDAVNGPYDELGIDVAVDGTGATGKAYPTISYYSNGTPKMATYTAGITKTSGMPEKSWENDSFTGKWDVCFVPTASNLLKDHINVAQPKGQDGIRARVSTTSKFSTAGGKDDGTVTGNTTTNPILGYAIREGAKGYMEIAQRK